MAGVIANAGHGHTTLAAGRDIHLQTVLTGVQEDNIQDSRNYLSGGDVSIRAGQDVGVQASTAVAERTLDISAGRDITIEAGTNTHQTRQSSQSKGSFIGLAPSGMSKGVTLFSSTQSEQGGTQELTSAAASTVGTIGGDATLIAGQGYRQTGSDVLAPGGDVNIVARDIAMTEAGESHASRAEERHKQTSIGLPRRTCRRRGLTHQARGQRHAQCQRNL